MPYEVVFLTRRVAPRCPDICLSQLFAQAAASPLGGDAAKLMTISEAANEDKLNQSIGSSGVGSLSPGAAETRRVSLAASSASFRPPSLGASMLNTSSLGQSVMTQDTRDDMPPPPSDYIQRRLTPPTASSLRTGVGRRRDSVKLNVSDLMSPSDEAGADKGLKGSATPEEGKSSLPAKKRKFAPMVSQFAQSGGAV